jgi:hypothetical protein
MTEDIEQKFDNLIDELTDDEWWEYVKGWFDVEYICDIMNNWDEETKEEAIEDLKKIIKNRKEVKPKHDKLRKILIDYGCQEFGDAIIDKISELFNYPKTEVGE